MQKMSAGQNHGIHTRGLHLAGGFQDHRAFFRLGNRKEAFLNQITELGSRNQHNLTTPGELANQIRDIFIRQGLLRGQHPHPAVSGKGRRRLYGRDNADKRQIEPFPQRIQGHHGGRVTGNGNKLRIKALCNIRDRPHHLLPDVLRAFMPVGIVPAVRHVDKTLPRQFLKRQFQIGQPPHTRIEENYRFIITHRRTGLKNHFLLPGPLPASCPYPGPYCF